MLSRPRLPTFVWGSLCAAGTLGLFVVWVVLGVGGARVTQVFTDLITTLVPVAAGAACLVVARNARGRERRAWALIGASVFSWALGNTVWGYYEIVLHKDVPFPSMADVGYLGLIPLAALGLLTLPSAPDQLASRVRTLLDGFIILTSILLVSWPLVLGPTYREGSGTFLSRTIGLAYPAGDVVLVTMALLVLSRAHGRRATLALICGGLLALGVADSGFSFLTLHSSYSTGNLIDAGWVAGFLLIGLAALRDLTATSESLHNERSSWGRALLPYVMLPFAIATVGVKFARGTPVEPFVRIDAMILMGFIASRQFLAIAENVVLAHSLERKVADRTSRLAASEERARSIVETANDAFVSIRADGIITDWNRQAELLFGWTRSEAIGRPLVTTIIPEDTRPANVHGIDAFLSSAGGRLFGARVEIAALRRDGAEFPAEVTVWETEDPEGALFNAFVHDISERKAFEAQLSHQALHDPLTKLANRTLFTDRVTHALERSRRLRKVPAVVFFDVDNFKHVNDSLGHAAGDQLLVEIAVRLQSTARPGDTAARVGGDEFAVLLEELTHEGEATEVAQRIMETLEAPFEIEGREVYAHVSVGVAMGTPGGNAVELLRNADIAMYTAKLRGKARCEIFDPSMRAAAMDRVQLEADLRHAIEREEFQLLYQPIVDLETGRLVGSEALMRWNHPTRGLISPTDFVPIAEDTGLIVPLGRWALETACRQVRTWRDASGEPLAMNVNLSVRQLHDPRFPSEAAAIMQRCGVDPGSMILEITESTMMEDNEAVVAKLEELRETGVRLAVDDFGTGYSSLSYLRRLPIDILKIDKSFVDGVAGGPEESALARAIIKLAETLRLSVTAEGVETPEQAARLRALGCRQGQGYLFAPPLPAEEMDQMLSPARPVAIA